MKKIVSKSILILVFTFVCIVISNVFAEPFGTIIYSIKTTSDFHVAVVNVASEEKQILTKVPTLIVGSSEEVGTMPFLGVGAPPFLGDPCVIQGSYKVNISLLSFDGMETDVVPTSYTESNIDPCFSFDGQKIAYVQRDASVSNEDVLCVVNVDGSDNTEVYRTPLWDIDIKRPVFSPDGSTLAFEQEDFNYGWRDIYTMPVTGGIPQILPSLPVGSMHPAYSPDGKKLACVSQHGGSTFHLFIITSGGEFALYPSFSPDSKYIAIGSDNGISIIDLSNNQMVKEISLDYQDYYGLVWSLGAQDSGGTLVKAKIKSKSISLKLQGLVPESSPNFGLVKIDNIFMPLDDVNFWSDKKGKKFMYKDKENKRTAKIVVKSQNGKFTAKKLELNEGTDYRLMTNIPVVINIGNQTLINTIEFDEKGKYTAPK